MNVNFMLFSVNDILDYKLIEENNFTPKLQVFSLNEAFQYVFEILNNTLPLENDIDC